MQKQFVTYEIAKKLKELGFAQSCCAGFYNDKQLLMNNGGRWENKHEGYHNQECLAPLWQQAIDWLREEHDIHVLPVLTRKGFYQWQIYNKPKGENTVFHFECDYKTNRTHVIEEALKLISKP